MSLELEEGIFEASQAEDPSQAILTLGGTDRPAQNVDFASQSGTLLQMGTAKSRRAHLFALYPQLLALLSLPQYDSAASSSLHHFHSTPKLGLASAQSGPTDPFGSSGELENLDFRELSKLCLQILGQEMRGGAGRRL